MNNIHGKEELMSIEYNNKVEAFCEEYGIAVDEMDHPNSILTRDFDREFISDQEIELMERVVMSEARGECYQAQEGVATVILNRWQYPGEFGDTIEEVLSAERAFAKPYTGEVSMSVHLAVKNAIIYYNTYCQDLPSQVVYFRDSYYHDFGIPFKNYGNLYFSASDNMII